mmetsp:Transcript_26794/g.58269  ORF Transcript_26794/g.58269 Transcript_26794/m.58269 type:complete len:176 (-) Transcript_26794:295-822(-)
MDVCGKQLATTLGPPTPYRIYKIRRRGNILLKRITTTPSRARLQRCKDKQQTADPSDLVNRDRQICPHGQAITTDETDPDQTRRSTALLPAPSSSPQTLPSSTLSPPRAPSAAPMVSTPEVWLALNSWARRAMTERASSRAGPEAFPTYNFWGKNRESERASDQPTPLPPSLHCP